MLPEKKWNIVLLIMPFFKTKYVHLKYVLFRVPLLQIRIEIKQNFLWNNEFFVDILKHSNTYKNILDKIIPYRQMLYQLHIV